jgi:hypothetical protein
LISKKKKKNRKLSNKININFLINYKSNNNFLIYIFNIKKIINIKNIIIKKKLEFNPNYQTIPDTKFNKFLFLLDQIDPIGPSYENFKNNNLDLNRNFFELNNNNQFNINNINKLNKKFYN